MEKRKANDLPGNREQRVFIGGQYDFMPTLRILAEFVRDISTEENTLFPIIPYDYDIPDEETMDGDIRILNDCKYAIFDLSDLGAQLVEMEDARRTVISTL
jgi:hypothetical protein